MGQSILVEGRNSQRGGRNSPEGRKKLAGQATSISILEFSDGTEVVGGSGVGIHWTKNSVRRGLEGWPGRWETGGGGGSGEGEAGAGEPPATDGGGWRSGRWSVGAVGKKRGEKDALQYVFRNDWSWKMTVSR